MIVLSTSVMRSFELIPDSVVQRRSTRSTALTQCPSDVQLPSGASMGYGAFTPRKTSAGATPPFPGCSIHEVSQCCAANLHTFDRQIFPFWFRLDELNLKNANMPMNHFTNRIWWQLFIGVLGKFRIILFHRRPRLS